jgi:hypothetical protein
MMLMAGVPVLGLERRCARVTHTLGVSSLNFPTVILTTVGLFRESGTKKEPLSEGIRQRLKRRFGGN